jgi:hypothetical protein
MKKALVATKLQKAPKVIQNYTIVAKQIVNKIGSRF